MSKKPKLKPVAAALGASFAVSLAAIPMAGAAENPFVMTELESGYMVAGGEGYCGANVDADSEANSDHKLDATDTGDTDTAKDAHEDDSGANQEVISEPLKAHQEGNSGEQRAAAVAEPVKADREGNCGGKQ